eukprot:971929_1
MSKRKADSTSRNNEQSKHSKTSPTSMSTSQSESANRYLGEYDVNTKHRSVLSHPLALPLLWALHGQGLSTLAYLSKESTFGNANTAFDNIFEDSFNAWRNMKDKKERTIKKLTELVSAQFE